MFSPGRSRNGLIPLNSFPCSESHPQNNKILTFFSETPELAELGITGFVELLLKRNKHYQVVKTLTYHS